MRSKRIGAVLILLGIIFWGTQAIAGDIEAGTFSVGASSDAAFYWTDSDRYDDKQLTIDTELGYFIYKNWEVGAALALQFGDDSFGSYESYSLLPYIGYHWSLNDKSNIYGRIGGGYGFGSTDFDDGSTVDTEIATFFAEAGYEYFFSKNVSLGFAVRGSHSEIEFEADGYNDDDDTREQVSTRLSFKLYF